MKKKVLIQDYPISLVIRQSFFLPKSSEKSRSVILDGSRSLGLFKEGKTCVVTNFHKTALVICSHSREGQPHLIAE